MPSLPDAIILCGGAGLRLRSVTGNAPKAMARIGGRPFLELLLRQLRRYGFRRVVLAVGFREDMIRAHFGDHVFGLDVKYSSEAFPLGTGGALCNAACLVESDLILVMNGDSYTDIDLNQLLADHRAALADISVAVIPSDERGDCGSVLVDQRGNVERFAEKQCLTGATHFNAGIYVTSRELLSGIPGGLPLSLEQDLFPRWLGEGRHVRAYVCTAKCVDIGTPDRYRLAQEILGSVETEMGAPDREDQACES